jgi:hypothetical protein
MILFFGAEFAARKFYNGVIPPTAIAKGNHPTRKICIF